MNPHLIAMVFSVVLLSVGVFCTATAGRITFCSVYMTYELQKMRWRDATAFRRVGYLLLTMFLGSLAMSLRLVEVFRGQYVFGLIELLQLTGLGLVAGAVAGLVQYRNDAFASYRRSAWIEFTLGMSTAMIVIYGSPIVFKM
jgi:hypothetical protein